MSEVAKENGIAWWTVHRVLVKAAADVLGQAAPMTMIGIDETRARSVRWIQDGIEKIVTWRRSDPWMTSIVDLDRAHPGGVIGLAAGRSGACVEGWIALQSTEFRAAVRVVAIDPSAPYAAWIRRALPEARIVLDHFRLVMLANAMVTDVRGPGPAEVPSDRVQGHELAGRARGHLRTVVGHGEQDRQAGVVDGDVDAAVVVPGVDLVQEPFELERGGEGQLDLAQPVGVGAGLDDVGVEGQRSTIAAASRGSVKVWSHSLNGALLAQATEARSSRSVMTWNSSSAPRGSRWT